MIEVFCARCKQELNEPGGIIFSPPEEPACIISKVDKMHLCCECYLEFIKWLKIKDTLNA